MEELFETLLAIYQKSNVSLVNGHICVRIGSLLLENCQEATGTIQEFFCPLLAHSLWLIINADGKLCLVWLNFNVATQSLVWDILATNYGKESSLDGNILEKLNFRKDLECSLHDRLFIGDEESALLERSLIDDGDGDGDVYSQIESLLAVLSSSDIFTCGSFSKTEDTVAKDNDTIVTEETCKFPVGIFTVKEPIIDRKSVFYGHAAKVTSRQEAMQVVKSVREKYHKASHNIFAFRVMTTSKSPSLLEEDCDDDGERPAGSRLLVLLQRMNKLNVIVVVTRFYGGIHLGPVRFKRIQDSASSALSLLLEQEK